MFLEMAKDMPRGRADSLSRGLVPLLVVMALVLGVLTPFLVREDGTLRSLEQQVDEQAERAGVLLLDDVRLPAAGGRQDVRLLVDGRPAGGRIEVDGDAATLLVVTGDGSFVPVATTR